MMPFDIAERYALGDVEETDKVFMAQEPEIMGQGLDQILNIEMGPISFTASNEAYRYSRG